MFDVRSDNNSYGRANLHDTAASCIRSRGATMSTYELLMAACDQHADKVALRFVMSGQPDAKVFKVRYRELQKRVTQMANAFYDVGIRPGKSVALLLPNFPQTYYALFGAQAVGVVSPIDPTLSVADIVGMVNETQADVIVALAPRPHVDLWEKAMDVVDQCTSIKTLFVLSDSPFLAMLDGCTARAWALAARMPRRRNVSVIDFDSSLRVQPSDRLISTRRVKHTEVSSCFHELDDMGGRAVIERTHFDEVHEANTLYAIDPSPQVVLSGKPLYDVHNCMLTGLAAFNSGSEVILLTPSGYRDEHVMQNIWKLVERFKATTFDGAIAKKGAVQHSDKAGGHMATVTYALRVEPDHEHTERGGGTLEDGAHVYVRRIHEAHFSLQPSCQQLNKRKSTVDDIALKRQQDGKVWRQTNPLSNAISDYFYCDNER